MGEVILICPLWYICVNEVTGEVGNDDYFTPDEANRRNEQERDWDVPGSRWRWHRFASKGEAA